MTQHLTLKEISEHLASSVFEERSELSEAQQRHLIECELCGERAGSISEFVDKLFDRMIGALRQEEQALRQAGHLTDFEIETLFAQKSRDEALIRKADSHAVGCSFCRGRLAERLAEAYEKERKEYR